MFQVITDNGKYVTKVHDDGNVKIERYREDWRDVTGDKYILSLLHLIEAQQNKIEQLEEMNSDLSWGVASAEGRAL